jgi:hypothetical protein
MVSSSLSDAVMERLIASIYEALRPAVYMKTRRRLVKLRITARSQT